MSVELISIFVITCLAVISPGPDFAMTLRNSIRYGRSSGLMTATGIASGVSVHVAYTIFGFTYILMANSWLLESMKIAGACYLAWIGVKSLWPRNKGNVMVDNNEGSSQTGLAAFWNGFLCNALNPKTALFFMALFTQIISPETGMVTQLSIGVFIALAHLIWFAFVALLLTHDQFNTVILKAKNVVEKITGACLLIFGVKLLFHAN